MFRDLVGDVEWRHRIDTRLHEIIDNKRNFAENTVPAVAPFTNMV